MIAKKNNHVVRTYTGWAVRKTGANRATKLFSNKAEAVQFGIKLSRRERLILFIHKKNGSVQDMRSY